MTRPHSLPALLGICLLALVTACGGGGSAAPPAAAATPLDLLARRPDMIIEEPGVLVPTAAAEWGSYGLAGWYKAALEHPTTPGAWFVPANQPVAVLNLPATGPQPRTSLVLEMWCLDPPGAEPPLVDVRLNGADVGPGLTLTNEPQRIEIDTPKLLWHAGENVLEIQARTYEVAGEGGTPKTTRWHKVAVARVEYGVPRAVTLPNAKRHALTLPHSTGVRYFVEAAPGAQVRIKGRVGAAGELGMQLGAMDPATGTIDEADFPPLSVHARNGVIDESFPTPAKLDGVLQIELVWDAPAGGELVLEELTVTEEEARPRPPIVFISIDTFAARHLAMHGYGRETTPNLERFRAEAVQFQRCVANAPWTMPSYLSVLTGLYPRSHVTDTKSMEGLQLNNIDHWQVADNRWTMAEMLRGRGYRTAGFVDTAWLSNKFRVAQGFDHYDTDAATLPFSEPAYGIAFVAARVAQWLDGRPDDAPPFLFLHALDAHGPYWPEFPFKFQFQSDLPAKQRMALAGGDEQTAGALPVWMSATLTGPPPPKRMKCFDHPEPHPIDIACPLHDEPQLLAQHRFPREQSVDEIIARYDETLRKVDSYLAMIFDMLKARGLYDEAMIVVTGDHGESFDHDFYGHGRLWEDIVHVPLLIKMPGAEFAGRAVAQSVELVDLYPTMFEVAYGAEERPHLHGRSLLPLMRGENVPARPTFSEGGHLDEYMVELDGWKLVVTYPGSQSGEPALVTHRHVPEEWLRANFPELVDQAFTAEWWKERRARPDWAAKIADLRERVAGPFWELYDLTADPGETNDLYGSRPDMVEKLKPLLEERQKLGRDARGQASWSAFVPEFDPETAAALSDIGYAVGNSSDEDR